VEIYYDTEFIDNGKTVQFISIGMIREDGKELYRITDDMGVIIAAARVPWLKENVLSALPLAQPIDPAYPFWDESHEDYQYVTNNTRTAIDVANFILGVPDPSLWAWFSAYDHVVLSQFYGRMLDMPRGVPMRTNDVAQEAERLKSGVPVMEGNTRHNSMHDAREVKMRREHLQKVEAEMREKWLRQQA
jgi:hypothetical protein